jgi:hypothetical protein
LPGDTELAGHLGLGAAGGKQRTGLHADAFERLAVTQTPGVAAIGGWSHAAMLPVQAPVLSPEPAKLFYWADSPGRRNSAREHSYLVITRDVFSLTA